MAIAPRAVRRAFAAHPDVPIIGERLAVTHLQLASFLAFFVPGPTWFRTVAGVPNGAQVRKFHVEPATGTVSILWAHPTFPPPNPDGSPHAIEVQFALLRPSAQAEAGAALANAVGGPGDPDTAPPGIVDRVAR